MSQWLSGKQSACDAGAAGDAGLILGWEDPLKEGMTLHSSILAWGILPRIEEPDGLHRVAKSLVPLKRLNMHTDK